MSSGIGTHHVPKRHALSLLCLALALVAVFIAPAPTRAQITGETVFAVTSGNRLIQFNSATPTQLVSAVAISGVPSGESILGIDVRPATGGLYAISSASRLYTINAQTGVATAIGTQPLTPLLAGTAIGFDFNPSVDRIRLVNDADQNLRLNPITGAVAAVDTTLAYAPTDVNAAANPSVTAAAYTSNISGTTSTSLYVIDSNLNVLARQGGPNSVPSPNTGQLFTVGALGVDTGDLTGFDIADSGDVAFAALTATGGTSSGWYTISLATGAATLVGTISGGETVVGIAIAPQPAEPVYALTTSNKLLKFNSVTPGTIASSLPITGLATGESLLGLDFRPADGQLYAISSASRVYVVNVQTGAATAVGTQPLTPLVTGTGVGFDFNPAVDRIRVVTEADQNLRLNPTTGVVAAIDGTLVYTTTDINVAQNPAIVAAGYTNNISGTTSTALYVIDANLDTLALQSPPNNGTLATVGALGIDVSELTGFDITPAGTAFVATTAPGATTSSLGTISLATGRINPIGTIGGGEQIRALAIPTRVAAPPSERVYALTSTNQLIQFNSNAPATILAQQTVSGLVAGETLQGIDFRPANGVLYGVSSASRIYIINPITGVALPLGAQPFTPALAGDAFGFDFNPVVDRIRLVSNSGQNLRLNPNTGAAAAIDGTLVYTTTDTNVGATPAIVGAGYTNNISGTTSTALYVIDATQNVLALQNPPNNGVLSTVGLLGVDASSLTGFDITPAGTAYVSIATPDGSASTLGTIDLLTGRVTAVGTIGGGATIRGIAVRTSTLPKLYLPQVGGPAATSPQ